MTQDAVPLRAKEAAQNEQALEKNASFFADNEWYKSNQERLETYRLIAQSASHEVEGAEHLLDIGNGGVFIFPIDRIPHVEAIDVFVEESFSARYPGVKWRAMNVLDLADQSQFDTVIAINCLHHVIGNSVAECYKNLNRIFEVVARATRPGGKVVLIESTVPAWFLRIYKALFAILLKLWPLKHPPTFQYHFREIQGAAKRAGLEQTELAFIPKVSNIMTLGVEIPGWLSPIRIGKFVFRKPQSPEPESLN
jgi:SAM-dependent methyltransferase